MVFVQASPCYLESESEHHTSCSRVVSIP